MPAFELTEADVRYEDEVLLVVSKPSGLPVHATLDPARPHLLGAVRRYVEARGGAYVALHHRLDVDTSGLVVFAKSKAVNRGLAEVFSSHAIDKRYRAVVQVEPERALPDAWRTENFLGRDRTQTRQTRYTAVRSGGKKAITEFRVVQRRASGRALLEARPITGRAHQIRVHCAEAGLPIVGDRFYGGAPASRLLLHALSLQLPHPSTDEALRIEDPMPAALAGAER